MKRFVVILTLFVVFFTGCNYSKIEGEYVKIKDNDRAGDIAGIFGGLVTELDFKGNHCNFKYLGMPMSGNYEIDKNYVYVHVGGELGTLSFEIIDKNTLEGEGWAAGTFKKLSSFKSQNRPAIGYYKTKSNLIVRAGPGTNYSKIETLPKGTNVKVVSILNNGWCEIERKSYSGFVSKKYLVEERPKK